MADRLRDWIFIVPQVFYYLLAHMGETGIPSASRKVLGKR